MRGTSVFCEVFLFRSSATKRASNAPDAPRFASIPTTPLHPMLAHGAWVTVRSPASGTIVEMNEPALAAIRALPSYFDEYLAPFVAVGGQVAQTVDACTVHGCFNLSHPDAEQLERDYDSAQALVSAGIYGVQEIDMGNLGCE